ncbi:MAG: redoxin domain-containing protein, partial [Chlorobi bacterium]|nr:redoxin domain-containing protein [Chlorobiota bacterium]
MKLSAIFFLPILSFNVFSQVFGTAPEIKAEKWINSDKNLTIESLRGKVVLIEFWTFGCYNCKNTIPYINEWYEKYKSSGLEIIG